MGFNRRKMENEHRHAAAKEAAGCRATDPQIIADAERLVAEWNERQAKRMPTLFISNQRFNATYAKSNQPRATYTRSLSFRRMEQRQFAQRCNRACRDNLEHSSAGQCMAASPSA
jgi:hypothetical protein